MWFHDIASRGRDNVAGRTISRLALTITRVGTIPRPGHDIVGKPTILPRGPTISRAGDDIAPRERYRTHARYRQCARRYPVPPDDIARHAHDNAGWHDITPRSRYRGPLYDITAWPATSQIPTISQPLPRYRHGGTISAPARDIVRVLRYIANRPTKSRILTISRPPRQYRTNRRVVMGRRRVNGRSTIRRRRGLFGRRSRTYRCVGRNTLPPGVGVGPRGGVPLPVRRSRETVICLLS